jgi:hypothetical protein
MLRFIDLDVDQHELDAHETQQLGATRRAGSQMQHARDSLMGR